MGKQLTMFGIDEDRPKPRYGNCQHYHWVKYFGGRHQECSCMLNQRGTPLRPKASRGICMFYDFNQQEQ